MFVPPTQMDSRKGGMAGKGGFTSRGVMCWQWMLVVVLVCAGTLLKLVEVDPISAVVGTCPGFCLMGGPKCG